MAWGLQQQPAGSATAAGSLPCLLLPAAVRSIPNKVLLNQVRCMNQLRCKLTLSVVFTAAKSHRSRNLVACSTSGSSAEVAQVSRPADVSTAQSDQSMTRFVDSVPGTLIVIYGYWTGPGVDDGCGSVEALLQRIE
ncbi:unnamed protein product [Urochloa decumbens]|uniref:Uncharacterized protein n=1 Tax=Urochloa decumbens TaxID=240449 RepID=A0ABC9F8Z7_9POAL